MLIAPSGAAREERNKPGNNAVPDCRIARWKSPEGKSRDYCGYIPVTGKAITRIAVTVIKKIIKSSD